jgi:hypothetical protein
MQAGQKAWFMFITTCDCCPITMREAKEDKNLKHRNNHPEEDNLKDGVMLLEQLENGVMLHLHL